MQSDNTGVKMPASGGTEILLAGLYNNTSINNHKDINLVLSNPYFKKVEYSKKNLLWQHLNYSDESLLPGYTDPSFLKLIDSFVYVSNWQYEKYRWLFKIPLENSYVIKNAIKPIEFLEKPKNEKIKLIYTSTPFRGLDILLSAFELLNRDDVELDVYSSTLVYGSDYQKFYSGEWDHLFDKAKAMKNVNYMGYATNDDIHKALQSAHIFAYPSTFEETCCLSMIEAGAAGCRMVTTNLGALYETGSEYAKLIPLKDSHASLIKAYANALNEEIDNYWSLSVQDKIKEQSDFYNNFYSWDKRALEWNALFEKMDDKK